MKKITDIKKRFESKFKKTKGCWLWQSYKTNGYGGFYVKRPKIYDYTHRISYYIYVGKIGNYNVLHKCDNPICVNPKHLWLGTHQDNMIDKAKKFRAPFGSQHSKAKITEYDVIEIRKECIIGKYGEIPRLAKKYNLFKTTIYCIIHRKTWKHI